MGVRKIRANTRSITGFIASVKSGGLCDFESKLERDYADLFDFDPEVSRQVEQPFKLNYLGLRGRRQTGVPDFLVYYTPESGRAPQLVDVKYRSELFQDWPKLKPRLRAARAYAIERGWTYKIKTDKEINAIYLVNARFLLRYLRQYKTHVPHAKFILEFLQKGKCTPDTLACAYSDDRQRQLEILPDLWYLVADRTIQADLYQPLTMASVLWLDEVA